MYWLDYKCSHKIRNGKYAFFWRVKLRNLTWKGNWKVGVDCGQFDSSDPSRSGEVYKYGDNVIHYAHKENQGILTKYCDDKYYYIYFGDLILNDQKNSNNVVFTLSQNNPYGVYGISFDCIELYEIDGIDSNMIDMFSLKLVIPETIIRMVFDFSGYFDFTHVSDE